MMDVRWKQNHDGCNSVSACTWHCRHNLDVDAHCALWRWSRTHGEDGKDEFVNGTWSKSNNHNPILTSSFYTASSQITIEAHSNDIHFFSKDKPTLSLDFALELIHADRESLKRTETFAGYPGHYGHRAHDTIRDIHTPCWTRDMSHLDSSSNFPHEPGQIGIQSNRSDDHVQTSWALGDHQRRSLTAVLRVGTYRGHNPVHDTGIFRQRAGLDVFRSLVVHFVEKSSPPSQFGVVVEELWFDSQRVRFLLRKF